MTSRRVQSQALVSVSLTHITTIHIFKLPWLFWFHDQGTPASMRPAVTNPHRSGGGTPVLRPKTGRGSVFLPRDDGGANGNCPTLKETAP